MNTSKTEEATQLLQEANKLLRAGRKFGLRVVALPGTLESLRERLDSNLVDNILSTDDLYAEGAFGETLHPPKVEKARKPKAVKSASA